MTSSMCCSTGFDVYPRYNLCLAASSGHTRTISISSELSEGRSSCLNSGDFVWKTLNNIIRKFKTILSDPEKEVLSTLNNELESLVSQLERRNYSSFLDQKQYIIVSLGEVYGHLLQLIELMDEKETYPHSQIERFNIYANRIHEWRTCFVDFIDPEMQELLRMASSLS